MNAKKSLIAIGLVLAVITAGAGNTAAAVPFVDEQTGDRICQATGYAWALTLHWMCSDQLDQEIESTQPSEIQFEIYTDSLVTKENRQSDVTEVNSGLNQTYGIAQAKAKSMTLDYIDNSTDESTAQTDAADLVRGAYTESQKSLLHDVRLEIQTLNDTLNTIETTDGLSKSDVFVEQNTDDCGGTGIANNAVEFSDVNVTLHNGTTQSFPQAEIVNTGCSSTNRAILTPDRSYEADGFDYAPVEVKYGDNDTVTAYDPEAYVSTLNNVNDRLEPALTATSDIVSGLYDKYDAGDTPDRSEDLGPLETAITGATNYDKTGSYDYLTMSMVQSGIPTDHDMAFKVTYNNSNEDETTAWGQLFVGKGVYDGTLETGTTYNATDRYVTFVHDREDDAAVQKELDGSFTIEEMRNVQTGDEINQTSVQSTDWYTDDISDFENQLEEAQNYHANVTQCSECTIGLPSFGDDWTDVIPEITGTDIALGVSAVVIAFIALASL